MRDKLPPVSFKANFRSLGQRLGPKMKAVAGAVQSLPSAAWRTLQEAGQVEVAGESLTAEDVLVTRQARGEVVIEAEGALSIALGTRIDDAP